jgi:1-acyl-sn-glycerol-3-phosphate acyltransferase
MLRHQLLNSATKSLRFSSVFGRAYRFLGHALCWILFGLISVIVSFLVVPAISLFQSDRSLRQARARAVIGACFSWFVSTACLLRLISCRVTGSEHYDPDSSQLILANHPTLIDVVLLISLFPQVDCVIKEAVTRNPVLRASVRNADYISNYDPADLLASCVERLRSGASLLLFPEGTRSVAGEPLRFKPGAAEIALRADATILPAIIDCEPMFLTKGEPWYRIPSRAPHFDIRILPPVRPGAFIANEIGTKQARLRLNAFLQALFEAELT